MDGVHDMGGMDGFGPVVVEQDEPPFHARWEAQVLAMTRAAGAIGAWGIDRFRFAIEQLPPAVYLSSSYYERWLGALEANLVAHGMVGADELAAGRSLRAAHPTRRAIGPSGEHGTGGRGLYEREVDRRPRFGVGDRVLARNIHPASHTRLPRYVRGHLGTIERVHGCHVFPDAVV
ncbi:MAG: nitrile hydratase subunit beta, partial [Acidimicrobiales bacterium]